NRQVAWPSPPGRKSDASTADRSPAHLRGARLLISASEIGTLGVVSDVKRVSFGEALRAWAYVGLNSFGGPAGQISVMHREIVERRRWVEERRFLDALNYCML